MSAPYQAAFALLALSLLIGCSGNRAEDAAAEQHFLSGLEHYDKGEFGDAILDFSDAIEAQPNHVDAIINRGAARFEDKQYSKSIEDYTTAIELLKASKDDQAKLADALINRGLARETLLQGTEAQRRDEFIEAIDDYSAALNLSTDDADAFGMRGDAWIKIGEHERALVDFALADVTELIENDPEDVEAYVKRGLIWYEIYEFEKAVGDLTRVLERDQEHIVARRTRADALYILDRNNEAIRDYTEVIKLSKGDPAVYCSRGLAHQGIGEFANAIEDYRAAISIDSIHADGLHSLAWIFATCPVETYRDGKQAVEQASKVCELSGRQNWEHLDGLAAAYAEAGDFEKAVEAANEAIALLKAELDSEGEEIGAVEQRLALYQSNMPFREPSASVDK